MEHAVTEAQVVASDTAEQSDLQAITELSAHDLALVGGGIATVVFM